MKQTQRDQLAQTVSQLNNLLQRAERRAAAYSYEDISLERTINAEYVQHLAAAIQHIADFRELSKDEPKVRYLKEALCKLCSLTEFLQEHFESAEPIAQRILKVDEQFLHLNIISLTALLIQTCGESENGSNGRAALDVKIERLQDYKFQDLYNGDVATGRGSLKRCRPELRLVE